MYRWIGEVVGKFPALVVVGWILILALVAKVAPPLDAVTRHGEFAFLPGDSPSLQAEQIFRKAFPDAYPESADAPPSTEAAVAQPESASSGGPSDPDSPATDSEEEGSTPEMKHDPLGSSVVIVLRREDERAGLNENDRAFIADVLVPELTKIKTSTPGALADQFPPDHQYKELPASEQIISAVWSFSHDKIGPLLDSADGRATLIIVELKSEFLDRKNSLVVKRIEWLIERLARERKYQFGLDIALSGSATVGRDMLKAERESASRTDAATKILLVILLLLIYRAPFLALIPLVTVGIACSTAAFLLRLGAQAGLITFFSGLEVYIMVIVYGSGIDYCLFLIARYKEELDLQPSRREAMTMAVRMVGAALATSAATSFCGVGMMAFAEFGKFRQAGIAIGFGLIVALVCCLTLAPALLLLFGKWTFWPDVRQERIAADQSWVPQNSLMSRLSEQQWVTRFWDGLALQVKNSPGRVFLSTILIMAPIAIMGICKHNDLSYGLLTDLPGDASSVLGAHTVEKHFAPGVSGTTTMLVQHPQLRLHADPKAPDDPEKFGNRNAMVASEKFIRRVTEFLADRKEELGIADIRTQTSPVGIGDKAAEILNTSRRKQLARRPAYENYVALQGDLRGQVFRLDFVFDRDPFERGSIAHLTEVEMAVQRAFQEVILPAKAPASDEASDEDTEADSESDSASAPVITGNAKIHSLGSTAGIRDLKVTTDGDQIRIDVLVTAVVYVLLVAMLRLPAVCAYLILTVIFSYFVALGMTWIGFYYYLGKDFSGIDWKVPIYLFTLLLAMGEDYNILLMSRVQEEQAKHGLIEGTYVALQRTGSIISSCGIIMAGSLASLMTGTLMGMVQMGFALAVGMFLDTFIIRPILVPSYLFLLYRGTFGPLTWYMGGPADPSAPGVHGPAPVETPASGLAGPASAESPLT